MKFMRLILASACVLMAGCTPRPDVPKNPESVSIVLYHPLSGFDALKTVGDWAMLGSGEVIQIETSLVLALLSMGHTSVPVPDTVVEPRSNRWVEDSQEIRGRGIVPASLDRTSGVICVDGQCSRLYALCPPLRNAMATNAKCKGFKTH